MRTRVLLALFFATAVIGPAAAQQDTRGGIPTETQGRMANPGGDLPWDLLGLFGLFGLIGLVPRHSDDSYHPAPLE